MRPPAPSGASLRPLVDFFTRSITSFQQSTSPFQVICTIQPTSPPPTTLNTSPSPIPPKSKPPCLVILDSSFNPPTRAHLLMAASAFTSALRPAGSRLLLLLAINNADKAAKAASFPERMAMMWAFAHDIHSVLHNLQPPPQQDSVPNNVIIPTIDIALSTQPYFHDKSAVIAKDGFYNPDGDTNEREMEQVILAGYDTLIRIFNPRYYAVPEGGLKHGEAAMQRALGPFLRRAKLRVTMRTDDEWGGAAEQRAYLEDLVIGEGLSKVGGRKEWGQRIELVDGGGVVVSSTLARAAAAAKDWATLDKMVSLGVRGVVEGLGLYEK
ncbi:hypothetical protein QBC34DRAFT_374197 [Podospora aff. communis PSN243]|uniref:Nicotinamide-nucleotide adenylyltransferase n=1 Tax=Podospora aff. communis PSN243 TaxID=3040156 RepID=A0AAV9H3R3_9PEZI|nr:hypothetical protein QBC34DRAFT_374197 [Podospora aff. communis PSN243]